MTRNRPTTIGEMKTRLRRFRSSESVRRAVAFKPRRDDLFISPYAKCGTTWMQQIVHGIRTRGSMRFDEITEVIPWIEMAYDMGVNPDGNQVADPRVFKSHLSWDQIPKGARYICIIRNPADVLVSLYHFFEGWFFEAGSITLEEFAREEFMERTATWSYWSHLASWWPQRDRPDVLMLCYEHMLPDLPGAVRRVAEFLDIALHPDNARVVETQSSIDFMRAHGRQFDDHLVRSARDPACGLPTGADTTKVRRGGARERSGLPGGEIHSELDRIWRREISSRFGLTDYQHMCNRLKITSG